LRDALRSYAGEAVELSGVAEKCAVTAFAYAGYDALDGRHGFAERCAAANF
jgi:hypothetical protein